MQHESPMSLQSTIYIQITDKNCVKLSPDKKERWIAVGCSNDENVAALLCQRKKNKG